MQRKFARILFIAADVGEVIFVPRLALARIPTRPARLPQRPPARSTTMPSQDAWGLALQFLPAYLTDSSTEPGAEWYSMYRDLRGWRPNQRRQEGRDLLAVVLAQKPHSPEAYHAHSEAKLLLLRRALSTSQHLGRHLLHLRRRTELEFGVRVSAHEFATDMHLPRLPHPPIVRCHYLDRLWGCTRP